MLKSQEITHSVVDAEIASENHAGLAGLARLREEFQKDQFKNFDKADFANEREYKDSVWDNTMDRLANINALVSVMKEWELSKLQPGEILVQDGKAYKSPDDYLSSDGRDIQITDEVDKKLLEQLTRHENGHTDLKTIVHSTLFDTIKGDQFSDLQKQLGESDLALKMNLLKGELQAMGPGGSLYQIPSHDLHSLNPFTNLNPLNRVNPLWHFRALRF